MKCKKYRRKTLIYWWILNLKIFFCKTSTHTQNYKRQITIRNNPRNHLPLNPPYSHNTCFAPFIANIIPKLHSQWHIFIWKRKQCQNNWKIKLNMNWTHISSTIHRVRNKTQVAVPDILCYYVALFDNSFECV